MVNNQELLKISTLIISAARAHALKKAVFSKPTDKTILKIVMSEKLISGNPTLQAEYFHKDNKVTHKNFVEGKFNTGFVEKFLQEKNTAKED